MPPFDSRLEARALAILEEALERPAEQRRPWATEACAADEPLRGRVLALLDASANGGALKTGGAGEADDLGEPPERLGAYRLAEPLGQGGMGAVYRAERDVGDFQRTVAIKIIRPGAFSDALTERFGRERQTLANLIHPHIARLYDGGQTDDGQPYIVMEHVVGLPILEWVRERGAALGERIALLLQACEGVRFAHQNLVVHRDLTPSNVLVTAEGQVKLIDFGIARPPEETAAAPGPPPGDLSLTPGYAAPERSTGAATSTLMDVYSLGELLRALTAGFSPDADLTAIAARAAAPQPERRYGSVDALIDDLQRWRDGRAVAARGGGRRYVLGKFVRRHWRAVTASAAAVALLTGALAVTSVAYTEAERARAAEARRFADLRRLASWMIFELNGRLSRVAGNTQARLALAAQAQRYLSALAESPLADAELKREAARGLVALAYLQGVPGQPNLGQVEQARANLRTALTLVGDRGARLADAPAAAEALTGLAIIEANLDSDLPGATRRLTEADAALSTASASGRDARWRAARSRLGRARLDMAVLGQQADALLPLAERLEADIAAWPVAARQSREAEFDRAYADYSRAIHDYFTDALPASVAAADRARVRLQRLDAAAPNDPDVLYQLAWTAYMGFGAADGLSDGGVQAGRFLTLAEQTVERLLRIEEADNSVRTFAGQIAQARAQALAGQGRHAEALAAQRRVIALYQGALDPTRRPALVNKLATAFFVLGNLSVGASDRAGACDAYARQLALMAELDRRNALLGSVASHRAPAEANVRLCAAGAPPSAFTAGS